MNFARELSDLELLSRLPVLFTNSVTLENDGTGATTEKLRSQKQMIISQQEKDQTDLFRFKSLHTGEDIQKDYMIAIEDINEPANANVNPYGTFTVLSKTLRVKLLKDIPA